MMFTECHRAAPPSLSERLHVLFCQANDNTESVRCNLHLSTCQAHVGQDAMYVLGKQFVCVCVCVYTNGCVGGEGGGGRGEGGGEGRGEQWLPT